MKCACRIAAGLMWMAAAGTVVAQCDPREVDELNASDGQRDDDFGWSVAISGGTILVGARLEDGLGDAAGAAYLFERVGDSWAQAAKLTASDSAMDDQFGGAVAVDGDTAMIGAKHHDEIDDNTGSVYVFERLGGVWTETDELTASDAAFNDGFGHSVVLDGDAAYVGTPGDDDNGENSGSVYVVERINGVWTETDKLTASDGEAFDQFGASIAASDDHLLIGAFGDKDNGSSSGSVYVFEKRNGTWTEVDKLTASDGEAFDHFGISISVSGGAAIVGARWDDDGGDKAGSAYVFERSNGQWAEVAKLGASDAGTGNNFGSAVSLTGDTALVAAPGADSGTGAAYVFRRGNGTWTEVARLTASDGAQGDSFGWAVAVDGDDAVVGAIDGNGAASDSGSAYVYDLNCGCPADFDGDGVADTRDFVAYLNAWADEHDEDCSGGGCAADFNGDGVVDTRDFIEFLGVWAAGC